MAEDVADELRALHLSQPADRAGPQWGGGSVDPHEAADEMLDEIVQPYLEDLERHARIGAVQAAREIGLGVLMGCMPAVMRRQQPCPDPCGHA